VKSLVDIADETAHAHARHGQSFEDGSDDKKLRRLVEEVGEVARALEDIELTAEEVKGLGEWHQFRLADCRDHLRAELVQVASLAIRWIDKLDGAS
jgi:NTP pyrophosphatase (non-canonical NTP hydrolase)